MGDAEKTMTGSKQPDRLAKVLQAKRQQAIIDGKDLTVVKWNLKTSCEMMRQLGKILEKLIGSAKGQLDVAAFLSQDLGQLINDHYDDIVAVLTRTVQRENFKGLEEAQAWVEELGIAEAAQLFTIIVEQNLRPLVQTAREIGEKLKGVASTKAREELRPST